MTRARDLAAFVSNADGDIKFDTDTLFIDSSANRVGIGTNTPSAPNEIVATSSGAATDLLHLRNNATATSTGSTIKFVNSTAGNSNSGSAEITAIRTGTNTGDLTFSTSDSSASMNEAMRIDNSGNLILKATSDVGNRIQVNGADETSEILEVGIVSGGVQITASHASGGSNVGDLIFRTRGGGSTAERIRVTHNGLTFNGDTAAANALDDYEEGTWTPSSPDVTLSGIATSTYMKIGRMVFVQARFTFPSSSSSTQARVDGLPFTVEANGTNSQYNLSAGEHTFGSYITCPAIPSNRIVFRPNGASSVGYQTVSGDTFRLSGWYETSQ